MARINIPHMNAHFDLPKYPVDTFGIRGSLTNVQVIMVPANCILDVKGKSLRGCVLARAVDGLYLCIANADRSDTTPLCRPHHTLFHKHPTPISGYPRVPIIRFDALAESPTIAGWTRFVYVLTIAEIDDLCQSVPQFIGAAIDRVVLSIDTVEPILRAIMVSGKASDDEYRSYGNPYYWDRRTTDELASFFVYANRHLSAFADLISGHTAPYRCAMDRKLHPVPIEQFNTDLRRDLSAGLFEDIIRTGCVIAGSYVLRALTNGQSDFKTGDIDVYCTDDMFSKCVSLHRCSQINIIATKCDIRTYSVSTLDIADIITVKSFTYYEDPKDAMNIRRPMASGPYQVKGRTTKIQFIVLRDGVDICGWIRATFDVSFLTSTWCNGKFTLVDAEELVTRTGSILPSYIDGLNTMAVYRVWMTMLRIVKYTKRGFRISNIDEFTRRVMQWFKRITVDACIEAPDDDPSYDYRDLRVTDEELTRVALRKVSKLVDE